MKDWRPEIGHLIKIHQEIRMRDVRRVWSNELPRVAAAADRLQEAEERMGVLDPAYKSFLRFADGWPAFYQWVDLFGTPELLGEEFQDARTRLMACRGVLEAEEIRPEDAFPIAMTRRAVSSTDPDVFFLLPPKVTDTGKVLWCASEIVDEFSSFDEFFSAMTEYNRIESEELKGNVQG